jgi:PhzF family phenazine biosynthesis protein
MSDTTVPFALYDAFSDRLFGGSQGGIILNAGGMDAQARQQIASELGLPATCFVSAVGGGTVNARFHSTAREYPMCGHGTICLMTHLLAAGQLQWQGKDTLEVKLILPTKTAQVEIVKQDDRALVMLDITAPKLRYDQPDLKTLAGLLGLKQADITDAHPVATALGDFVHMMVPIKSLKAIQSIQPDFTAITAYCRENGIETLACFSVETAQAGYDFHVRDFCPAVGVPESAAAGTTNAALATYWHRHGFLAKSATDLNRVKVEQGMELGRPSSIHTSLHSKGGEITRIQVGGVATKVIEGHFQLPEAK